MPQDGKSGGHVRFEQMGKRVPRGRDKSKGELSGCGQKGAAFGCQPVFLEAALGFIGDGSFDQLLS